MTDKWSKVHWTKDYRAGYFYTHKYPAYTDTFTEGDCDAYLVTDSRSHATAPKDASGWRPPLPYHREIGIGYAQGPAFTSSTYYVHIPYWESSEFSGKDPGNNPGTQISENDVSARMVNTALLRARQKVLDQKVHFGNLIGTQAETAELVASTATRILRGVRAAKRLDFRGLAKALKKPVSSLGRAIHARHPSQMWLEASYGWLPLLQDVHGAVTEYDKRHEIGPPRLDVKAKYYEYVESLVDHATTYGGIDQWSLQEIRKDLVGCTVHLTYEQGNNLYRKAAQLGLIDPLEVAWEVLPWSFVVDWFLPVGNWLQTLSATAGLSFKGGSATRIARREGEWIMSPFNEAARRSTLDPYGTRYRRLVMDRQVYDSDPIPNFWDLANPWGAHGRRVIHAAALASSNLDRLAKLLR